MATADSTTDKAGIYATLSSLNIAFSQVVRDLHTLQQTGLFKTKAAKLFPGFAQELQAEFNQEFLSELHDHELEDWAEYGKARQRWEKHLRDPDDVFIHAEERRKEIAKQQARQKRRKQQRKKH